MTEADRDKFNEKYTELCDLLAGKDSRMDTKSHLYFDILQEFDIELVLAGINQSMRVCKFFPKPAEIFEIIEGKENEHIDFAYQEAKRIFYNGFHHAVRLQNPITMQTISDMGGQQEFYNRVYINGENDTAAFFEFKRIYKTYYRLFRSGNFIPGVKYLPGYMDTLPGAAPADVESLPLLTGGQRIPQRVALEGKQPTQIVNDKVLKIVQGISDRKVNL